MNTALIALAFKVGAPMVERILAGRIGGENTSLLLNVVSEIAQHAGIKPDEVEQWAASDDPERVKTISEAVMMAEDATPELIALYTAELKTKIGLFAMEQREPFWAWAWRPAGMWMLLLLWLWNAVILHVLNAWFKIALPPMDYANLIQISALYMSLYMGGHTVKDLMTKWAGGRPNA